MRGLQPSGPRAPPFRAACAAVVVVVWRTWPQGGGRMLGARTEVCDYESTQRRSCADDAAERSGRHGMHGELGRTGDGPLPFIVAGVVLVAAAVLVVAFVLMRRNR